MVDWSGHERPDTAERYRLMAQQQLAGISPSYERLCLGIADDAEVVARLDTLPLPKRQPNLLLAAVRFVDGPVDGYDAFRDFVLRRWDDVAAVMRARRTQTNEARRCAGLLPALAAIEGPVALFEVGASAGLCLQLDRYAYRYDGGPVLGNSALTLDCATTGPVPVPTRLPEVVWRAGLDLNPLDAADPDTRRWLEALIWPEETDRFDTLCAALDIARAHPVRITRGDLTTDLAAAVADAPAEATLVVMHSAVLSYLDAAGRAAFRAELAGLGRPVVWLANEGPGIVAAAPARDSTPFVLTRDGAPLALTAPHGEWLEWLA